ncbi:hypothetical protein [Rhodococcus qingshengii]
MLTRQTHLEPLVEQLESEIANAVRIQPVRRKAVRLLRMCGYTNRQVGIILGISDSHVGSLAQRKAAS